MSFKTLLIWLMYLLVVKIGCTHSGQVLYFTGITSPFWKESMYLSRPLDSNMWLQSSWTNLESMDSSNPNTTALKTWLVGSHVLHRGGHCSPQSPRHSCWQGRSFLHGRWQGFLSQASEHSLVHLECSHWLLHCSLQRLQTSEHCSAHYECLHFVIHFFSMH